MLPQYRRWYRFGWRSPMILISRVRNKHRWLFRLHMAYQRAVRGYGYDDLWGLNYSLAKLTVVGCRNMRINGYSYPAEFAEPPHGDGSGREAWESILLTIEKGFQAWLDEDGYFYEKPEQEAAFKEAMELYARWFSALWD